MLRLSHCSLATIALAAWAGSVACGGAPTPSPMPAPPKQAQSQAAPEPPTASAACEQASKQRAAIPALIEKGMLSRARRVITQVMAACPEPDAETRAKDLATSAELSVELLDYDTAQANATKLLEMQGASEPLKQRAEDTLAAAKKGISKRRNASLVEVQARLLIRDANLLVKKGDDASLREARKIYYGAWDAHPTGHEALGLGIVARKLGDEVRAREFFDRAFAYFDAKGQTPKAALPNYERLVTRIDWSSDGRFVVVAQGEEKADGSNELAVLDTITKTEDLHWFKLGNTDDPVALSSTLALLGIKTGSTGFVVDIEARMVAQTLSKLPTSLPTSFSPDLSKLAVADDRDSFILNLVDGSKQPVLKDLPENDPSPMSILFSPTGKLLAVPLDNNKIALLDTETQRVSTTLGTQDSIVMYSAFSRDGTHLLTSTADKGEMRLWDTRRGALRRTFSLGANELALAIAVSADGSRVAATLSNGLTVWNAKTGAVVMKLGDLYLPTAMAFSPDGERLAVQCVTSTVCIANLKTNTVEQVSNRQDPAILSLAISKDGKTLAALPDDNTLRIIDLQKGTLQSTASVPEDTRAIAVSNDGTMYATTGAALRIWNAKTGATLREEPFSFRSPALAFSPDGTLVAVAAKETLRLYSTTTKDPPRELSGHTSVIGEVVFSPDGRLVATGSFDKTIRVWDLASGTAKHVLSGHTSLITGLAFSADGKLLASAAGRDAVKVWDVETGAPRQTLKPAKTGILDSTQDIAFSPKGPWLAAAGRNNNVDLWDLTTNLSQAMHRAQSDAKIAFFTPDGEWLITGWDNGTVMLQPSDGKGPTVSIRFIAGEDASYVVHSDGHADLLGSRPCAARNRIWCRTEHLGLPFDLCEDQVLTRGLLAKTLARASLASDPLHTDDLPSCEK